MALAPAQKRLGRRLASATAIGALALAGTFAIAAPAQADSGSVVVLHPGSVDFSQSRTSGHNVFTDDALHVYTDDNSSNAKAAGYISLNESLSSIAAGPEPALAWDGSSPEPGNQLVVDLDQDGVADSILVGEPTFYGNEWWLSTSSPAFAKAGAPHDGGGEGSEWFGTLAEWSHNFPGAVVMQGGYSLGSGVLGNGTLSSMTYGSTEYDFSEAPASTTVLHTPDLIHEDTRSAGHTTFLADGLHVYTDDASSDAKADGYIDDSLPLADAGQPQLNGSFNSGTVAPGLQLIVDFNNDGLADGTLVGEPDAYQDDFWASNGSKLFVKNGAPLHTGGSGSANHGTLAEWDAAFPNAHIMQVGYSLGSGVQGDYNISSIDVGTTRYTFANTAPVAPDVDVTAVSRGEAVDVTLDGTDLDGDALTYNHGTADHGTVSGSDADLTYTPTGNYSGPDSFSYTVNDGVNADVTGTVNITVSPTATPTLHFSPPSTLTTGEAARTFTATTVNPADGQPVPHARYDIVMTGDPGLGASQVTLQYQQGSTWLPVPLTGSTVADNRITGYFGPSGGFPLAAPDSRSTTFRISVAHGAPAGRVTSTVSLDEVSPADENSVDYTVASATSTAVIVANHAAVTPAVAVTTTAGKAVHVTLAPTDADHDALTVSHGAAHHGSVTGTGTSLTYKPVTGFVGTDTFSYSATDAINGLTTGIVTVHVGKAATVLSTTQSPTKVTSASRAKITVKVTSTGVTTGGKVTIKDSSTLVGTGTVRAGTVVITLPKLNGRTHALTITYAGTASSNAASSRRNVAVAKVKSALSVTVNPSRVTTRTGGVTLTITVSAPGAVVDGAIIKVKGTRVNGAVRASHGKVTIRLPRLSKGTHSWTVSYAGTSTAAATSKKLTISVRS